MSDNQAYNDAKAKEDKWRTTFFTKPVYPESELKKVNEIAAPVKQIKSKHSVSFAKRQKKSSVNIGV